MWLRKRRQYICSDENHDSYSSLDSCRHADDDLRLTKCTNKNNNSLVEVLKSDIECGWSSAVIPSSYGTLILVFIALVLSI